MAGPVIAMIFGLEPFAICAARTTESMVPVLEVCPIQITLYVVATNTILVKLNTWEADAI
tara:strand:- start:30 stop:209 length:180 start_codon:yes stop_codon:yes gene_type:complete